VELDFFLMAVFAGFMGSYGLVTMSLWSDSLGLPRLDFSRAMSKLTYARTFEEEVSPGAGVEAPNTPYWPGMIVLFMNGIFFALLYSSVVAQHIPIDNVVLKGAAWGVILWFVSGMFFVPFYLKEGFMLAHIHRLAWLTSLKVHIVYGLMVGWIAPISV
jgi:hypothetical protein